MNGVKTGIGEALAGAGICAFQQRNG